MKFPRLHLPALWITLLCASLLAGCGSAPEWKRHDPTTRLTGLTVTFLDVGEGDATLLQWGDYAGLIDGGPARAGPRVVRILRRRGIDHLDWMMATHPHSDHIGGLAYVAREIRVDRLYDSGFASGAPLQARLYRELERWKTRVALVKAGETLDLGGGLAMFVFSPWSPFVEGTPSDANNNAIVGRLMYGKSRMLLASDMEEDGRRLLYSHLPAYREGLKSLRADVLRVAHHGGADGTDARLLQMTRPKVAVISCGARNDYAHPHRETLDVLRRSGAALYRTDLHGDVTVTSDGKSVWVSTTRQTRDVWAPARPSSGSSEGSERY